MTSSSSRPMPSPLRWRSPFLTALIISLLSFYTSAAEESNIKLNDVPSDVNRFTFENPSLRQAYIALQAWKQAIFSDPFNFTANWSGPRVCSYGGVFCGPSPSNSSTNVVAGIDLNHADIAGFLPDELGLLTDLALFHLNSNRFCGVVPSSFKNLKNLFELDISNNRFVGGFPNVVISLPKLKFLDLRFNEFEGGVPNQIFDKDLGLKIFEISSYAGNNCFMWFGPTPAAIILDPDTIREVLTNRLPFPKPSHNPANKLLTQGLATYEADKWAKHRKLLSPTFQIDKLKLMLPAFYLSCCDMLNKWEEIVHVDGSFEVDIWPYIQELTSDAISRTAFGSNYKEGRKIFELQNEQVELVKQENLSVYIPGRSFANKSQ